MAAVRAGGPGDRDERRSSEVLDEYRLDGQLLAGLPAGCLGRVLTGFHVSARREPQARVDVVHQQAAAISRVEDRHVRNEVPVRGRRLDAPEHVVGGLQPMQRVGLVLRLDRIPRCDAADQTVHDLGGREHGQPSQAGPGTCQCRRVKDQLPILDRCNRGRNVGSRGDNRSSTGT